MLLFGHVGITLGAAAIAAGIGARKTSAPPASWVIKLSFYLDIRFLLIGSLLPDIIDKPVGRYLFLGTYNNGRIFAHTLVFLLVLVAAGLILLKTRRSTWMLALAAGTFAHLALDEMWFSPVTLFWPVLGWQFP